MKNVHVRDRDGKLVFTRLIDKGTDILEFESGYGWVSRHDLVPNGWTLHDGWPKTQAEIKKESA